MSFIKNRTGLDECKGFRQEPGRVLGNELAVSETCELLLPYGNPPHPDTLSAEPSGSQNIPRLFPAFPARVL
jgi:hypothetical protein